MVFLSYSLGFQSCVKDDNNDYPKITILKPYENQIFQVGDTISIEADISYSSKIEGILVSLCDKNFVHVMPSYKVYLKSNSSQKLNFIYPLDDEFLNSDDYYLEVSVTGDIHSKTKYAKLRISGIPKISKGLGLVVQNGNNTNLLFLDTSWQPVLQKTFFGKHIGSSYMPYHHIFMEITDGANDATAIDFFSGKVKWNITKLNTTVGPYFTGSCTSNNRIDILFFDNKIESFSYDGKKRVVYSLTVEYMPKISLKGDDFNFVYAQKKSNPENGILSVFYGATGALLQSYSIDFKMVKIFVKSADELVIFGNKNGHALVKVYYIGDNAFWEPRTLDAQPITDAVQLNAETYLFLQNGHLIKFDLTHAWIFDLGVILGNQNLSKMKFDELNSILYLSDFKKITAVNFPNLSYLNSYNGLDSIMDFNIIYNR